jgi:uncharacterized LabA/DUF88 family protein
MLDFSNRRVGIFIDVQNMYYSARNIYGKKVNFGNIAAKTSTGKKLIKAVAYTISTKTGDETPFLAALHHSGIEVNTKELLEYDSGHKKGDWDVGLAIDIVKSLDLFDEVILVSGDGDFVSLGEYIKARGRLFHVASFRESTSSKLIECADIYTNFSDDLASFLIADPNYRPAQNRTGSSMDTFDDVIAEQSQNSAINASGNPLVTDKRRGRPRKNPSKNI